MSNLSSKGSHALFSVIIPTYNRAFIIQEAIESVLQQEIDNVEIIVVDDGSTDNTKEVLEPYFKKIRYIYQENQGISGARNTGLQRATGKYISFLDSDDVFLPGKMKRESDLFDEFKEAEAIAGDAGIFKNEEDLNLTYMVKRDFKFVKDEPYILDRNDLHWIQGSMFPVCSMVVRRSVLDKLGLPLYDTSLPSAEDWDLEIRLIHRCKVLIDSKVYSHVRRFDDGTREKRDLGVKNFQRSVHGHILKKRILEKALSLDHWPDKTRQGIQKKMYEYESLITNHFVEQLNEGHA